MDKDAATFLEKLQQTLEAYWESFIDMLPRIAFAILLLIIVLMLAGRIGRMLNKTLVNKAHDPLFSSFIAKIAKITLIVCGFILVLHVLGLSGIAGGLLAGAGISAFIIGFAFKDIAENFLAGIILAFNRPFALDDTISISSYTGHVKALNFRTTHVKTFDEKDVFIPNAIVLKEVLTNLTRDGLIRLDFNVGLAYEVDLKAATGLILETLAQSPDILHEQQPFVIVEELGVSTVNLRIYFWAATDDYKKGVLLVKSDIVSAVKDALAGAGYSMPANIIELKVPDTRTHIPVKVEK